MDLKNQRYQNQGIHVIASIFTVEKGITKVLLIQRKNQPFQGMWALVGGALYNDEDLEVGMNREVQEKTGIENIPLFLSNVYGKVNRAPHIRMIAISYIGIIDSNKVNILKDTLKTSAADWFAIDQLPELAYDHREIIGDGLEDLKDKMDSTDILASLFPEGFTIPELQKAYETIRKEKYDRRNFRKKILSLQRIVDTGREKTFAGKKPAKIYKFKK